VEQKHKLTLGIIGGGQLAQMLAQNNPFHDLKVVILSDQKDCPAALTDAQLVIGSLNDREAVKKFFEQIQILTIENEFVDSELLGEMKDSFERVLFFPSIGAIEVTQNKLSQKFLFEKLGLPTAPFVAFQREADVVLPWLQKTFEKFPSGFMLKKAFGGYDGKGNFKVGGLKDFAEATAFIEDTLTKGSTVYAEELVFFSKELAQIYVRGLKQDFISYPVVISEQEKNVCRLVYGPATEFGVSAELEKQTTEIGNKIATHLNFVGTFAIEYFLTKDGRVLINEMAPRVHNSGHYTLDASPDNQFANHVRAILGAPLKQPATYSFFAMRNILGTQGITKDFKFDVQKLWDKAVLPENKEDLKIYWYGKSKTAPYRKLGHINTIAMTKEDLLRKIDLLNKTETAFWKSVETV